MKTGFPAACLKMIFLLFLNTAIAQTDTLENNTPVVKLSAFLDVFYCYDFNKPQTNYRQPFLYNHNRHNEFNINLGFVKVSVLQKKYRANLALQTGTYANDNYAAEPGTLKNINEANAGIKLAKGLWLDAGVFSSHLGFEGAVSIDYPTLTRSLVSEGSPYFLTGAKLTLKPNDKWELLAVVSNGWQRIQRVAGNSLPCVGTQVKYMPNRNTLLNWSTLIGTDDPDSTRRMRYFNNLYAQFQLNDDMNLSVGFDAGMQQQSKGSSTYNTWYAPVVVFGYKFNGQVAAGFRAEY
nr:porin [Chitinophagaceae bacterium]